MSYVTVTPELMEAAVTDLATIGSMLNAAHMTAAAPTVAVLPVAADEVSASIAQLLSGYGQQYQALAGQAAAFHEQFVRTLTGAGGAYAAAEATAASALQSVLSPISAQVQPFPSIYRAIQQANEQLLINFTTEVTRLEQPLAPFFAAMYAPPVPPPIPLPTPIGGEVSLIVFGTGYQVLPPDLLALAAQVYNLPGGFGALWQPNQFFPITPHLGSLTVGQSINQGAQLLEQAIQAEMANNPSNLTVWANSLSSTNGHR
jgi:hypothetical protein